MIKTNLLLKIAAWLAEVLPISVRQQFYRIPLLSKLIRHSLNAAAPEGFTQVSIAAGAAKGFKMVLDLHKEKDYWLGTYEPNLQFAAARFIHPGDVVYDIGANIGYVSLICAKQCGENGKVFAFEPLPENVKRLKENVEVNGLETYVNVVQSAVIESVKAATFLVHPSGSMGKTVGSSGRDERYIGKVKVPGISLDAFVYDQGHPPPDVIKLDIEGGESNALRGMKRLLGQERPLMLIELHGKKAAIQAWNLLHQWNYQIRQMDHSYPIVRDADKLNWKSYIVAAPSEKTFDLN